MEEKLHDAPYDRSPGDRARVRDEAGHFARARGRCRAARAASYHRIELQETGPAPSAVTVLMLTPAGAEAIGEDPTKIGMA